MIKTKRGTKSANQAPKAPMDPSAALMAATIKEDLAAAAACLALPGVDVNKPDPQGWTPLMHATFDGNADLIRLLADHPDIDLAVENEMGSALHLAAWMGRVDAMDALLAGGGLNPNLKGADGCTALIVAANSGRAESAKRLLEIPGIDVNARDNAGDTALIAAAHRRSDIVRMLLARAEIDASASNKEGRTAMDVARDLGEPEIFRLIGAHLARREAIEIARSLAAPGLAEGPKPTPRAKKARL
jgi:ankyrin repeat protein